MGCAPLFSATFEPCCGYCALIANASVARRPHNRSAFRIRCGDHESGPANPTFIAAAWLSGRYTRSTGVSRLHKSFGKSVHPSRSLLRKRLNGCHVEQRKDLKLRRNPVLGYIDPNQQACARQHCHFGMANLVGLPARQNNLHGLKRPPTQHFSKRLNRHKSDYSKRSARGDRAPAQPRSCERL